MIKGKVYAPAKINIGLVVGEKRPDGFHSLDSYFLRTTLCDEIFYEIDKSDELSIEIVGNEEYLDFGCVDLMEKAARKVYEFVKAPFSLRLKIVKNIPTKAGLGGGSSDAAATIALLSSYFNLSLDDMLAIAERVGSDVPFFINGECSSRVRGRGEEIAKADLPKNRNLLLIFPNESVSTKDAYARLDSINREERTLPSSLSVIDREHFPNDFELAIDSEIKNKLENIVDSGDYYSLSGSGSTWFILSDGKRENFYKEALCGEYQCKVCKIPEY